MVIVAEACTVGAAGVCGGGAVGACCGVVVSAGLVVCGGTVEGGSDCGSD